MADWRAFMDISYTCTYPFATISLPRGESSWCRSFSLFELFRRLPNGDLTTRPFIMPVKVFYFRSRTSSCSYCELELTNARWYKTGHMKKRVEKTAHQSRERQLKLNVWSYENIEQLYVLVYKIGTSSSVLWWKGLIELSRTSCFTCYKMYVTTLLVLFIIKIYVLFFKDM